LSDLRFEFFIMHKREAELEMKMLKPILLIEDDIVDFMTVKKALQHLKILNDLIHLKNGGEALEYLEDETKTKPSIIILDLNIPRIGGLELLKIIKANETLKSIPVIVMSTSEMDEDIEESFSLSVAGYIVKPVDFDHFVKAFGAVYNYWCLSKLPSER
jgi:CheY-like chemotaxis protein